MYHQASMKLQPWPLCGPGLRNQNNYGRRPASGHEPVKRGLVHKEWSRKRESEAEILLVSPVFPQTVHVLDVASSACNPTLGK